MELMLQDLASRLKLQLTVPEQDISNHLNNTDYTDYSSLDIIVDHILNPLVTTRNSNQIDHTIALDPYPFQEYALILFCYHHGSYLQVFHILGIEPIL